MTAAVQLNSVLAPVSPTPVASSQTVTGQNQAGSEPFRFAAGNGVPPWAVGKTSQEVLTMAASMADALQTIQPRQSNCNSKPSK